MKHRLTPSCMQASNGYYTFSNIRFGDAPIGPLRFRAPQAASPNRTLQTGHDGDPKCYQGKSRPFSSTAFTSNISPANPGWLAIAGKFIGPYLMGQTSAFYAQYPSQASIPTPDVPPADPSETEDCLFLDVKVPQSVIRHKNTTNKKIPVLIWLYGGGYTGGYKTQYSTDSLLARSRVDKGNGLILVQPNYRVGTWPCRRLLEGTIADISCSLAHLAFYPEVGIQVTPVYLINDLHSSGSKSTLANLAATQPK